jgi:hypothetical protein
MSPLRNWNTDDVLPESSDELDALIAKCSSSQEIAAVCKNYAERKGLIVTSADGVHGYPTGKIDPDARGFSAVVTVRGRRKLLTGARSQAELDAAIEALRGEE